ncbi:MAG: SpoIIIAH-like family protein, partial [Lachnospiraceae bacterium]|nr:SpoIIIAH-like family protein [Lachnospiraceae bacterium]
RLDRPDPTPPQTQEAVTAMAELTLNAEKESAAELLLEASGYTDCVVSITNDTADVVVNAAELTEAQRAQIEDIVKRKTEVAGENIVITPAAAVQATEGSQTDESADISQGTESADASQSTETADDGE